MRPPGPPGFDGTTLAASARRRLGGFTLLELVAVVLVVGTLMVLIVPNMEDAASEAWRDTTGHSVSVIRDAILGPGDARLPSGFVADVLRMPDTLNDLYERPDFPDTHDHLERFDVVTGLGWRGPYLLTSTGRYVLDPVNGFTLHYGQPGDPAILDAFGRPHDLDSGQSEDPQYGKPIVLQYPDPDGDGVTDEDRQYGRLVSAGPDGVIDTPRTDNYPTHDECGDDLVLYLRVADRREKLP